MRFYSVPAFIFAIALVTLFCGAHETAAQIAAATIEPKIDEKKLHISAERAHELRKELIVLGERIRRNRRDVVAYETRAAYYFELQEHKKALPITRAFAPLSRTMSRRCSSAQPATINCANTTRRWRISTGQSKSSRATTAFTFIVRFSILN